MFGTTRLFLERLGLDSLDELPSLAEFIPYVSIVEALERGLSLPTEALEDLADEIENEGEPEGAPVEIDLTAED